MFPRARCALVIATLVLAGCGQASLSSAGTSTIPSATVGEPSPTPELTPDPLVLEEWNVMNGVLSATLMNPNDTEGVFSGTYTLTTYDADGEELEEYGRSDGGIGDPCCTIFRMPPAERFFVFFVLFSDQEIADVRLTDVSGWRDWTAVDEPTVTVSDPELVLEDGFLWLEGRVSHDGTETFENIWISVSARLDGELVTWGTLFGCVPPEGVNLGERGVLAFGGEGGEGGGFAAEEVVLDEVIAHFPGPRPANCTSGG